jgi:heme-degrading monooxygenase HmoA
MLLVRDIFKCKPGRSKALADQFSTSMSLLADAEGFNSFRILLDFVGDYWTVVLESEVDDLAQFEQHMREWGERDDVRKVMEGYMDNVLSGYREVFRIVT